MRYNSYTTVPRPAEALAGCTTRRDFRMVGFLLCVLRVLCDKAPFPIRNPRHPTAANFSLDITDIQPSTHYPDSAHHACRWWCRLQRMFSSLITSTASAIALCPQTASDNSPGYLPVYHRLPRRYPRDKLLIPIGHPERTGGRGYVRLRFTSLLTPRSSATALRPQRPTDRKTERPIDPPQSAIVFGPWNLRPAAFSFRE
jgi:hypothetical protein